MFLRSFCELARQLPSPNRELLVAIGPSAHPLLNDRKDAIERDAEKLQGEHPPPPHQSIGRYFRASRDQEDAAQPGECLSWSFSVLLMHSPHANWMS